ncbi:MAG: putative metal-binding motif-containing protein [Pseudomonadota bacterium]|nr:putative metal-binding motif-containing protein [Pseudomonadota bacterium]
MLVLPTLLTACLINQDLYDKRLAELTAAEEEPDADADADGFTLADDCDDGDATIHPSAPEACDGVDQDCDDAVDEDAVDAPVWYADADEDGFGSAGVTQAACDAPAGFVDNLDDCADGDAAIRPDAAEVWYDGVDQDCDGADDYDADADGDRADDHGGTDCNDSDATVNGGAAEGWADGGIDNNCDGSVEDPARVDIDDLATPITGPAAGAAFGSAVLAVPAGWLDEEAVLLAAAPFAGGGEVYGWRASTLEAAPTLDDAEWRVSGAAASDLLGFGLGWSGTAADPVVLVSAEGADSARGEVYGWTRDGWGGSPLFTITGVAANGYLGAQVTSGHDHDGDGIMDILATAVLDSRVATNAGASFLFLDVPTGAVSAADADIEFTTTYAGALLSVAAVGDADGDGLGDLGFSQLVSFEEGPGGLLVTGARTPGSYDLPTESVAQLYAAGNTFGRVCDPDGDGVMDWYVASGGVDRYALPLAGTVTPWDDATALLSFENSDHGVRWLRTDVDGYAGHSAFVASSSNYEGSRGMVGIERPYWRDGHLLDDAPFMALGTSAGDELGGALDLLDVDEDGILDLVVGAAGVDLAGVGAGAVYVLDGAR